MTTFIIEKNRQAEVKNGVTDGQMEIMSLRVDYQWSYES